MHPSQPFALLDDSRPLSVDAAASEPSEPTSRLYTGWVQALVCEHPRTLRQVLAQARQMCRQHGWHAVLLADYEWGLALHGLPIDPKVSNLKLSRFCEERKLLILLVFHKCKK